MCICMYSKHLFKRSSNVIVCMYVCILVPINALKIKYFLENVKVLIKMVADMFKLFDHIHFCTILYS